ncbi:MAG: ferritin-like domain-containing protein [Actinomycetota bacterium]
MARGKTRPAGHAAGSTTAHRQAHDQIIDPDTIHTDIIDTDKGSPQVDTQAPDTAATEPRSRRALFASLLAAGAAASVPLLAGRASAADDSATTTTAPPDRSASDVAVINALIEREASMVATYKAAVGSVSGDDLAALLTIHGHHIAYVESLSAYLGTEAGTPSGAPLALTTSGGYSAIAAQLAAHEGATAEAHIAALGRIEGIDAATLVASIITVVARHRAALLVSSGADAAAL